MTPEAERESIPISPWDVILVLVGAFAFLVGFITLVDPIEEVNAGELVLTFVMAALLIAAPFLYRFQERVRRRKGASP